MKGVLLVNLGTPGSPTLAGVHQYLVEFLTDPRVMDLPKWKTELLVRGIIVPLRLFSSTRSYQRIWTKEGSPLTLHTASSARLLQEKLGEDFKVDWAMRYPKKSCEQAIQRLLSEPLEQLIILPLFPQYASATTGSVLEHVMNILSKYTLLPEIKMISSFYDHPALIQAFAKQAESIKLQDFDRVLFSFHGLPVRQLKKANKKNCCGTRDCCEAFYPENNQCYAAQCYATARGIAEALQIQPQHYEICFQSRLGKEPWIGPFTSDRLKQLGKEGCKKIAVFCPSFVCDCLETSYEIAIEYQELFEEAGGETLKLIPGLNASPGWIEALKEIILPKRSVNEYITLKDWTFDKI